MNKLFVKACVEMKHITGKWNKDEIENTLEDVDFKIKYSNYEFFNLLFFYINGYSSLFRLGLA